MGYIRIPVDELDANLGRAWGRVMERLRGEPAERERRARVAGRRTYTRPVRSWALVLRANDRRMQDRLGGEKVATSPVMPHFDERGKAVIRPFLAVFDDLPARPPECFIAGYRPDEFGIECAVEAVVMDAAAVKYLCAPVVIPWPGVVLTQAAKALGVNWKTIGLWAKDGRIRIEHERVRPKRWQRKFWTPEPVQPGGEVWHEDWGDNPRHVYARVAAIADWKQQLTRTFRVMGPRSGAIVKSWECPTCGRGATKLFWPMRVWTMAEQMGEVQKTAESQKAEKPPAEIRGFECRRCCGLVYESAERRTTRPNAGPVDAWDRFIKRLSGGYLRGSEVARPRDRESEPIVRIEPTVRERAEERESEVA